MNLKAQTAPAREGRVVSSHGRDAVVEDAKRHRIHCRLQGRRLSVVCGDNVRWIEADTEGAAGLITEVRPRRTELARMNSRGKAEVVAANLTQLVSVIAPLPAPDLGLCDRYLAAAEWAGLRACVVANKSDLPEARALLGDALDGYAAIGYPVVWASKRTAGGAQEIALRLKDEISVLVGQSGVGKSSLINLLVPGVEATVQEISRAAETGQHTTSVASLYLLPSGGDLVDSPGVRDFAPPLPPPREIASGFREIARAAVSCRFKDCMHLREPGCAVAAAKDAGKILARRMASYRQLVGQAEELSRRDPQFRR
ncbi:MAG: Small ribosomal subunit biosis GTPase RsgA [Steroidobacteraceae bacterium]|nr:Small ribosomal subunit biosis GTPase RsgA [Steroidobacteraceae bacterium]